MMNTQCNKLYNEHDIEVHHDGISVNNTFFSKQEIANTFNELILVRNFVERQEI